jgi:hypothetical protein
MAGAVFSFKINGSMATEDMIGNLPVGRWSPQNLVRKRKIPR